MLRLLIVEESLRDLKAHWFEYIKTITGAAKEKGWEVDVATNVKAVPEITSSLNCFPVFEHAYYITNDNKLPGKRYYGFLLHSIRTLRVLRPLLQQNKPAYDVIFVPTVLIHHLIAWWYIMRFHPQRPKKLVLFFVTNPGLWNASEHKVVFPKSTIVYSKLLKLFESFVHNGSVTLAVETVGAKKEFETMSGLPFKLYPHPVYFDGQCAGASATNGVDTLPLNFACYGFARHEKGSDLFKFAIEQLLMHEKDFKSCFTLQWTDDFKMPSGSICEPGPLLQNHSQVNIIDKPLSGAEYQTTLRSAHCMVLPYRNSSYYARVSRVVIEAACHGIPMIYPRGGWIEDTVKQYGAGIGIEDESVEDLTEAIKIMEKNYPVYAQHAEEKVEAARNYFSPSNFVELLLK